MKKLIITTMFLVAAFALTGCSEDNNPTAVSSVDKVKPSERTTIVDVALAINADSGEFSTLIAAVVAADLVDALSGNGQLTVFAPTDAAFAALDLNADNIGDLDQETLTGILTYHVAKGRRMAEDVVSSDQIRMLNGQFTEISLMDGMAYINDAQIVTTDVPADNGIIHVIDAVLLPGSPTEKSPQDSVEKVKPSERTTIVDVALAINADSGEFSTLIAAVVAADLVDALSGNGQLTVFAPTDAAFAALDLNADNIGDLDQETLTGILTYHVAKGRRMAEDVVSSDKIRMLNGQFTEISLMDGMAYINGAQIVATNVPADNGVIHVIDGVLLP